MSPYRDRLGALASICIVLVVLHLGQTIVIPFLVSVLIAIGVSGVLRITKWGVPPWLAIAVACLIAVGFCVGLGWLFSVAISDLAVDWPSYRKAWNQAQIRIVRWFSIRRLGAPADAVRGLEADEAAVELALPGIAMAMQVASMMFLVLLLTVFLLIEGAAASPKLTRMEKVAGVDIAALRQAASRVQRYLWIKTATSAVTGLLAGGLTSLVGLRHPLLFGLLAFVLNFVPTVGSLIAMIPAVALAFLTMGWTAALILIAGYGVINVTIGLILEPRWEGQTAGLSPSAVVLSMVFWGFVLGPVGALLSIPLMMIVRIIAAQSPHWTWLEILLETPRQALEDVNSKDAG